MEQWRKDGLDELERSGYLPVLRNLASSLTAPFWWYDPSAGLGCSIKHNGTMCLVNTGVATIGITANHVYQEYLSDKSKDQNIRCQIGSSSFGPERHLNSADSKSDLATFSLPEVLIAACNGTLHYPPAWPPQARKEGELVLFGGYPGILREEKAGSVELAFVSFIGRVCQRSESHASFYLNISESHWPQGEALQSCPNLGGISGGPIFRVRTEAVETLELAGIVYEASQGIEVIRGRHISEISAEGRVS